MYTHRDTSTVILGAMSVTALCSVLLLFVPGVWSGPAVYTVTGVLLSLGVAAYLLRSLSVHVTTTEVTVWFGGGLFRRSVPTRDITDARIRRYPWYYGIGLRFIPRGWLYNARGMTAVEIDIRGNRRLGMGTSEPEALLAAINTARDAGSRNSMH